MGEEMHEQMRGNAFGFWCMQAPEIDFRGFLTVQEIPLEFPAQLNAPLSDAQLAEMQIQRRLSF